MLEGIEVLAASEYIEFSALAFMGLLMIGASIGGLIGLKCEEDTLAVPFSMIGILCGMIIYCIIFVGLVPTKYTQYKVTISEEVNMVEFYEKYEIVDVDGAIYTIRERGTE